jgi:DNA-binding response OmpR family regulator
MTTKRPGRERHMDKVLMIEDEKDTAFFFEKAFEHMEGIQFLPAYRATQGIQIALEEKPKVIVLDLLMPGMSGEEALKILKTELPESKFVVITAWEDGHTRDRIVNEIGVDAYYDKPINFEEVTTKIISLVTVT